MQLTLGCCGYCESADHERSSCPALSAMAPEVRAFERDVELLEGAVELVGLESPAVHIAVEWDEEVQGAIGVFRAFGYVERCAL